jgi:4-amino-4-deoxy-L-arabinose transferase-like glycosyltransferase
MRGLSGKLSGHWIELGSAGIWLAAAMVFRLWQLEHVPPGLHYDEAIDLKQALRVVAGARPIYVTEGWGREALYYYLVAGALRLIQSNPLALRLTAALCGVGVIGVAYWLARRLTGRLTAWFTAAWLSVTFWPVFTSRVGVRNITYPLVFGASVLTFWWAWATPVHSKGRWWRFVCAGVLLGLTSYTYQAARFAPLVLIAFAVYVFLFHRKDFRTNQQSLILYASATAAIALPLVLFLIRHPGAETGRGFAMAPLNDLLSGEPSSVLENGLATLKMFTIKGDPLTTYNLPGRPVFQPGWTGLWFYAGLALCVWRWRQQEYAFMLMWLIAGLFPTVITVSAPHFFRILGAQIPVMFLAALPIAELARYGGSRWSRIGQVIPILAGLVCIVLTGCQTWPDYFTTWAVLPQVAENYNADVARIAHHLQENVADRTVVISGPHIEDASPYILAASLDLDGLTVRWVDARQAVALPAGHDQAQLVAVPGYSLDPDLAAFIGLPDVSPVQPGGLITLDLAFPSWPAGATLPVRYLAVGAPWPTDHATEAATGSLPISFRNRVQLEGISLSAQEVSADENLVIMTRWVVLQDGEPASLAFFVHLMSEDGKLVGQQDGLGYPPHTWRAGDVFIHAHRLQWDDKPAAERYWVQFGLYERETGERWGIVGGESEVLGDRLLLGPIEVRAE